MGIKKTYLKDLMEEEVPKFLKERYKDSTEHKEKYIPSNTSKSTEFPKFESNGIEKKFEYNISENEIYKEPIKKEHKDASEIQGNYKEEINKTVLEKCSSEEYRKMTSKSLSLAGYSEEKVEDLIRTEFESMSPRLKMRKLRNLLEIKLKEYKQEKNNDKYEATKMIIDITKTLYPEIE